MTRKSHLLVAPLMLFVALAAFSQTPAARITTAERKWASFWRQFTLAINKKDHAALLQMMPSDFFDGGGGLTPKEWLKFIDQNEPNGSWRDLRKSMAGGANLNRTWSAKGVPTKVTRDNAYYSNSARTESGISPVLSATSTSLVDDAAKDCDRLAVLPLPCCKEK